MNKNRNPSAAIRWARFFIGLVLTIAFIAFLMSGPVPPGPAGKVIQHTLDADIQTTALFYMELDRMPDLEEHLEEMKKEQKP